MVELKGTHGFSGCTEMKMIMPNLQNFLLSVDKRKVLNSRVINGKINGIDVNKPNPLTTK
jgi:hypothetical protein